MEAKLFTMNHSAVVHWTVKAENVDGLTAAVGRLIEWTRTNEFMAHDGFGNARPPQGLDFSKLKPAGDEGVPFDGHKQDAVLCPSCDGPVWDNRNNKRTPQSPDYKCKDKNCGVAGWISEKDGSVRWAEPKL